MMSFATFFTSYRVARNARNFFPNFKSITGCRILSVEMSTKANSKLVDGEKSEKKATVTTEKLISAIAETHQLTKAESRRIFDTLVGTIMDSLVDLKSNVKLSGLGTFKIIQTKARNGRNPSTGESISIPAKERLRFVPISNVKNRILGETVKEDAK